LRPWGRASVDYYFPDPDHPDLQPFIQAFARMMFAHAEFEHRFANLVSVIARKKDDPLFGERPKNQWAVEKRAKELKNFAAERADRHAGGLPEIDEILVYVRQANQLSRDRNLLAHGIWWQFDAARFSVTVRSGKVRLDQNPHQMFTVERIEKLAKGFGELEADLYRLQRAIEARGSEVT